MFPLGAAASDWRWPLARLWPPSGGGWGGLWAQDSPPKVPVGGRLSRMQHSRNRPGSFQALKKKKKKNRRLSRQVEDVTVSIISLNEYRKFSWLPSWTLAHASAGCSQRGATTQPALAACRRVSRSTNAPHILLCQGDIVSCIIDGAQVAFDFDGQVFLFLFPQTPRPHSRRSRFPLWLAPER